MRIAYNAVIKQLNRIIPAFEIEKENRQRKVELRKPFKKTRSSI
jgi:hypothetical protein